MTPDERAAIERQVAGALRSAIAAHGPITGDQIGSAAKRVASQVTAYVNERERRKSVWR